MENQYTEVLNQIFGTFSVLCTTPFIYPYLFFSLFNASSAISNLLGITDWQLKLKLFSVFWLTAFFPAFAVFLLWRLKFSDSIFLKTQKDRIIPYVIVMFFYWWMYYLSRNFADQPIGFKIFLLWYFYCKRHWTYSESFYKSEFAYNGGKRFINSGRTRKLYLSYQ